MSAAVAEPSITESETLADVLRALGDIPLHRILWHPFPGTATEADQLRCCNGEPKRLVELIDGILVEKAMGHRESLFAVVLIDLIRAYVRPRNLGPVGAPDAIMKMTTRRNRLADVSFTPWERLPSADAHLKPVARFSGDLMVEIISEDNTRAEIEQKRREYFATGTRLVWIIEPEDQTVAVYTSPDDFTLLTRADTLDGGVVLSGFTLPLEDLFGDPQLNPRPE
jgi:Uma2 family endonuclease